MKLSAKIKFAFTAVLLSFLNLALFAQDKKLDVDIKVGRENDSQWYTNPFVWVIGGAVFILLLVALLRGKSKE